MPDKYTWAWSSQHKEHHYGDPTKVKPLGRVGMVYGGKWAAEVLNEVLGYFDTMADAQAAVEVYVVESAMKGGGVVIHLHDRDRPLARHWRYR